MAVRHSRDRVAFSDFVTSQSSRLFRTAYLVVGDHQLAQDLLQEALVKTYVAWPRIRDASRAEAYVRRTIVTTAISWRRRRSFHERPVEVLPERVSVDLMDGLANHTAISAALRTLPPRQRAALVLRYYEDLSEVQTAEMMGCSVGTVKSQVAAALRHLRERLDPDLTLRLPDDEAVTS